MKEYQLTEEEVLTVTALVDQRNGILAKYDKAMIRLQKSYAKEAGISDGNLQQRGADIFIVSPKEETGDTTTDS